jgi:GxxExxY protein
MIGIRFDEAFRSDLVVGEKVIVELKSVAALTPVHAKQLLTQLRLSGLRLGLLINFGEAHLKNESSVSSAAISMMASNSKSFVTFVDVVRAFL